MSNGDHYKLVNYVSCLVRILKNKHRNAYKHALTCEHFSISLTKHTFKTKNIERI